MLFEPPKALRTAASMTRCDALQMSGPVPSPSMKGITTRSGTESLPSATEITSPPGGEIIGSVNMTEMDGVDIEDGDGVIVFIQDFSGRRTPDYLAENTCTHHR